MKMAVSLGCTELKVIVNPRGKVTPEGGQCTIPKLYAPWPDIDKKGIVEIEAKGDTPRALLGELASRYHKADVDFNPVRPGTSEVESDYDVSVNGKNYVSLPGGLDARLKAGDEVVISMVYYED